MTKHQIKPAPRTSRVTVTILLIAFVALCLAASGRGAASVQDKKLTVEDIVGRHLKSVGSPETLAAIKTRAVAGVVTFQTRVGQKSAMDGAGLLISAGSKMQYRMTFPNALYPREQMGFDGAHAHVGLLPNGGHSPLSGFLDSQTGPLSEGLLGGVLSTAWPLLDVARQQPKLESLGLKKVDGQQLYEMAYQPRKGARDLKIRMYFDPETFHHVRTDYSYQVANTFAGGLTPRSATEEERRYLMTEEFDDFKLIDGLTLPLKYKLRLTVQAANGSSVIDWSLAVDRVSHTEKIEDTVFSSN